jgi:serine/threonine protein kinase
MEDISYKDYIIRFFGEDTLINDTMNIINPSAINHISELSESNSIFSQSYAEMYECFVILRKYILINKEFLKSVVQALGKLVHPNIPLFYGLMFNHDDENDRVIYIHIILEYFNGITLQEFNNLGHYIRNKEEENYLKLLIVKQMAQVISFLHKSGYPHLLINCKNIKINHNILMNQINQGHIIFNKNLYYANKIIHVLEIGSCFKYNKQYVPSLDNEEIYELSYHSPLFFEYYDDPKTSYESNFKNFIKCDKWSLGCLIYELFIGERPYSYIQDKKTLKDTILRREKYFKPDELRNSLSRIMSNDEIADQLVNLLEYTTEPLNHPNSDDIVNQLDQIIPAYTAKFFTEDIVNLAKSDIKVREDKELTKKIESRDNNEWNRYNERLVLRDLIAIVPSLTIEVKELEDQVNRNKIAYKLKLRDQENKKIRDMLNTTLTKKENLKFLLFNKINDKKIIISDVSSEKTQKLNLVTQDFNFLLKQHGDEDKVLVKSKFSLKNLISGLSTTNKSPKRYLRKFTLSPRKQQEEKFNCYRADSCIYFSKQKKKLYISGGSVNFETFTKKTNKLDCYYMEADLLEDDSNVKTYDLENNENVKVFSKNVTYNLIKRINHSILEVDNFMFFIGGEQDTTCEVLDLTTNCAYFIGSLNVLNIHPIVFLYKNKIYSLNIEHLKMKYESYLEEESKTCIINPLKRMSQSLIHENSGCLNKNFVFCESYERDITINSEWVYCDVFFNLPENFNFKIFQHYKYVHIDRYIYIFGCEDKSTKLSGVFFDIDLMQFNIMTEDSLNKFQVFRTALLMKSNIVEYDNHYYYLNCETGQIEKVLYKSLFTK